MHATIIIRAELIDSATCSAAGVTVRNSAPVLALCRKLLAAGFSSGRPLLVFRDGTLALRVRSIGEAARLEIDGHGTGFRPRQEGGTGPLVRANGRRALP